MTLQSRLGDCFLLVIEHTVASVGFYKAVHLRRVNKAFNAAVIHALCFSQVLDCRDAAIEGELYCRLPLFLKARILLTMSRDPMATRYNWLLAGIAKVNKALDALATAGASGSEKDHGEWWNRHLLVAEAVASRFVHHWPIWSIHDTSDFPDSHTDGDPASQDLFAAAIVVGNTVLVRSLLEDPQINVNEEAPYFGRPLQVAAAWGRTDILDLLLECGADAKGGVDRRLMRDAPHGMAMVPWKQFVLRDPASSALRAASLGGHQDIVRRLMEPQHRLPTTTVEYFQCITNAARGGHVDLVHLLTGYMDNRFEECIGLVQSMMMEACLHGQENVVRYLLDRGLDPNSREGQANLRGKYEGPRGALSIAAAHGNVRLVQLLLDRGADPLQVDHGDSQVPIQEAARNGHDDVVDLLLARGGLPAHITLGDLIGDAANHGQERLVRILIARSPGILATTDHEICRDHGAPGCTLGMALLSAAIWAENPSLIAHLVKDMGVSLNHGWGDATNLPLVQAKACSARWICGFLLSLGAEGNEVEPTHPSDHMEEKEDAERHVYLGKVRVSRRTWEWVGKH